MQTKHAAIRAKQRGIPPLIAEWLERYGEEQYDGRGGVRKFFTKDSRRKLERDFGREPLRRLHEFLDCYLVASSTTGVIITVGHRYQHRGK